MGTVFKIKYDSFNYSASGIFIEGDRYINDNLFIFSRVSIQKVIYELKNEDYKDQSINIIPVIGIGYPTKYLTFSLGCSWNFNDLKNEDGLLINNGIMLDFGIML